MDADVVLADDPELKIVGHVRADVIDGRFSYRVNWTGQKAEIQELGWVFELPGSAERFSWHRRAYWSWYPDTHIGRPSGTATPESADADVTKVSRPDAFDFNSTKYDCDWATLTDGAGKGLGVRFAPEARGHCRAGTTESGARRLIVNRLCCPPRDLSTGVVPDLYFTLEKGAQASGGFAVGAIGGS